MRVRLSAILLAGLLFWSGCKACGGSSPVPFKRGEVSPVAPPKPETAAASTSSGPAPPAVEFKPLVGANYPTGTAQIELGGAPLKLSRGWIAAALAADPDQDGDLDALLVGMDGEAPPALKYAERQKTGFIAPRDLETLAPSGTECKFSSVGIRMPVAVFALVSVEFACGAPPSGEARPSAAGAVEKHIWVVGLESAARILEHFALLPGAEEKATATVALELNAEDVDQDGFVDLLVQIDYAAAGSARPTPIAMRWMNRPGGLARDPVQPEKALAELAGRAGRLLGGDKPELALAGAEQVLAIHRILCRESGEARFSVGGVAGINCGPSAAAGKAAAIKATALGRKGGLFPALEAYAKLDEAAYKIAEADRKPAREALFSIPAESGLEWAQGPQHQLPPGPDARLSALAFVDESALLLRGPAPLLYDLASRGLTPVEPFKGNILIRDPSERFAVVGVFRGCEGYKLRVVSTAQAATAGPSARAVSEPLIEPRPAPAGSRCAEQPIAMHRRDGGYRVLGWTSKGIVLAKGARIRLVALDTEAQQASEPVEIPAGQPPPGPLPPGAAAPDGRVYALLTPAGIVLQQIFPSAKTRLLRPPQWDYAKATDVAISPAGTKLALLSGGRVYIADLAAASAPP